jgi:hypothetical protein
LPETASSSLQATAGGRIQLERSDGSRLTLTLTLLDALAINSLRSNFLRS